MNHRLSLAVLLAVFPSNAWLVPPSAQRRLTKRLYALPEGYREVGNQRILDAARLVGANAEQLQIEWKGDRIIVTISGDVYCSDPLEDDLVEEEEELPQSGVDLTALARAINVALDDQGVGLAIAEAHSIEVTTPGASDELSGIMFESYKGFDVLCATLTPRPKSKRSLKGDLWNGMMSSWC